MALTGSCRFFIKSNVYRNVIKNIGNSCQSTSYVNKQNNVILRFSSSIDIDHVINEGEPKPQKKLSKAMKAYLQRAKEYDEFIHKENQEYLIGKRHLANMMGLDPNSFTQKDVAASIQYLFPSGIYDPKARPIMDEPEKIFPKRKAAEFDIEGRPFSSLFYTTRPNYYQGLYDIVEALEKSNELEDAEIRKGLTSNETNKVNLIGSDWVNKEELEKRFLEPMNDKEYEYFIASAERLVEHPYSAHAKDLLLTFREIKKVQTEGLMITPLEYNEQGRPFIIVRDCKRKSATGTVKIWGNGTGLININGKDITYFYDKYHREQVIFPLMFTGMESQVDIEANVQGGGPTGQAGAVRWGISWGLRSFVPINMVEKMRIAGLLSKDWRRRERKKPGQEGARRKFTWKKR